MPHRRNVRKGSFGSHFDELVKHFPDKGDEAGGEDDKAGPGGKQPRSSRSLFSEGWARSGDEEVQT